MMDNSRPQGAPPLFEYSVGLVGFQMSRRGGTRGSGSHLAQIWIQLIEGEKRDVGAMRLTRMWRKKVGRSIPDAESIVYRSELHSAGNAIEINLASDDHDTLLTAAEDLKNELKVYPGIFDIEDSFLPGKREMQLKLKPAAHSLGLTLSDLALQVRHAFYGAEHGARIARKHVSWYLQTLPGATEFRRDFNRITDAHQQHIAIAHYFARLLEGDLAA